MKKKKKEERGVRKMSELRLNPIFELMFILATGRNAILSNYPQLNYPNSLLGIRPVAIFPQRGEAKQ